NSLLQNISGTFSGSTSAVAGTHTDTATASGTATDDLGHTAVVTASDKANYLGVNPSISIDKQVSLDGLDWHEVGPNNVEDIEILEGTHVYYRVIVSNTSDGPLTLNVSGVTDHAISGTVPVDPSLSGNATDSFFDFGGFGTVT